MKVRLKAYISGTRNAEPWPPPGTELDLPGTEAMDLCANGLADPVKDDKVEDAKAPQGDVEERDVKPRRARKSQPAKAKSEDDS